MYVHTPPSPFPRTGRACDVDRGRAPTTEHIPDEEQSSKDRGGREEVHG